MLIVEDVLAAEVAYEVTLVMWVILLPSLPVSMYISGGSETNHFAGRESEPYSSMHTNGTATYPGQKNDSGRESKSPHRITTGSSPSE